MMAESNGGGSVVSGGLKPHTNVTITTDPTLAQSLEIRKTFAIMEQLLKNINFSTLYFDVHPNRLMRIRIQPLSAVRIPNQAFKKQKQVNLLLNNDLHFMFQLTRNKKIV